MKRGHQTRRSTVAIVAALAAACQVAAIARAAPAGTSETSRRPLTALVLSGGGARGAAHLGVIEVLDEMAVPVDLIVGTSMGSVVGGLFAAGYSPAEMRRALGEADWRDLFTDRPARKSVSFRRKQDDDLPLFQIEMGFGRGGLIMPTGLVAGQKFGFLLHTLLVDTAGVQHFDQLPLPFRAVATDLRTGAAVVLEDGDLAEAIRASMAVPGVFTPVEIEGRLLVDGGLVKNLPVDVARRLGAERMIAVDVSTPLEEIGDAASLIGIAEQSVSIFSEENVREQRALLGEGDLLIEPDLTGIGAGAFDIDKLVAAVERGAEAARRHADRLRAFAVPRAEYEASLRDRRKPAGSTLVGTTIDEIHTAGSPRVDHRQIRARMRTRPGEPLELERVRRDLERIYEIGEFQAVGYRLRRDGDRTILAFSGEEKAWGPNYLRFGLALSADFEGRGEFIALGQLTRTQLNRLGAEWKSLITVGSVNRLVSEFYQPLDYRGSLFVAPSIDFFNSEVSARSAAGELERIRLDVYRAGLDVGAQFGNAGGLRLGVIRGVGDVDILTESGEAPLDLQIGGWRGLLTIDRLDNANFPRRGSLFEAQLFLSRHALGADQDYDKLDAFAIAATSFGKNTLLGLAGIGSGLGSDIPFFERFELGGFLSLSGLDPGAVSGEVGGVASAVYFRKIASLPRALGEGIYLGGSVEAGGAWESSHQVRARDLIWASSVFAGVDTIFGPIYLGYGRTENDDNAFYFFLGRLFSEAP